MAPVTIHIDRYLEQSRIEIPKKFLDQNAELQPSAVTPSQRTSSSLRQRTVLAGMTLSLLLVGGGLVTVLVRRRQGRAAIVTSVGLLAVLSLCVSVSLADIVPPYGQSRAPQPDLNTIKGSLVVVPLEKGDRVTLRIGRDLAEKLSKVR